MTSIDWGAFDTPFGPRTGGVVPDLLAKLDDDDARVRARALRDLHGRLVAVNGGFGRPFLEIAIAAVPILGARLDAPGALAPELGQLIRILGDVAAGNHRLHLARGLPVARLDRPDIGPARATQSAVAAIAPSLRARLEDADTDVRASAAFALAWLPGEAQASVLPLLRQLAREKNGVVRASLLVALGYLEAPPAELRARRGEKAPIGTCAAIGAMLSDPAGMDDDVDVALGELSKPIVKGFPFADGAIGRLRIVVLGGASIRRGDLARHLALVEKLPAPIRPEAEGWSVEIAAASAGARAEPLDPADLPEDARAVLRERAATLRTAKNPGLYQAFWRAGLFSGIDANERALGVDAPGPLDARIDGRPLWWWLHGVRAGRIELDRWLGSLRRGHDALAILEDAATAPYELYRDRARLGPFEPAPLIDAIERSAAALGVGSALLDEGLARLREMATRAPPHRGLLDSPWP